MPQFTDTNPSSFRELDLHSLLITNPESSFMFRSETRLLEYNILLGDILVVDRSLNPKINDLIVAGYEGELIISSFTKNTKEIWGKIIYIIHKI